jgi:hypothetical protein
LRRPGAHDPGRAQGARALSALSVRLPLEGRRDRMGRWRDRIGDANAGPPKEARGVRPWIMDRDLAERLWTESEEWTGARFTLTARQG